MKSLIEAVVIAALIATPLATFAQSNQTSEPLTRAQVRAELIQFEHAGYRPSSADTHNYPANLQAAEARVVAEHDAARTSGYGAPAVGSSQAGSRPDTAASSYSVPVVKYVR
ncbi:hypothetical protein BTH42_07665 [Burkholderia sp. SRS-W-2-2016]|uniref:DUF4148 domain-containing protein n=1 Tax=Burkholderia sp. SRS-W-2-2016 TaxID=1926878 RepID=UPI00094B2672|nr:DUF4148 domain-containing protein [Burkholderia sp. SRS-W-2-2016]OLL32314.1 hypothetical protein BTH42_07665 [Burkholderia sp. SRS-W-2-2016]